MPSGGERRRGPEGPAGGVVGAGALAGLLLLSACAVAGGGAAPTSRAEEEADLVPAGHGTLRQNEVTLSLRRQDLLVKATPLAEEVIRLTAPDTYQRLRDLREDHRQPVLRQSGVSDPALFLVSFFSYEPDVRFEPEDVHLVNRGLRHRPLAIRAVTPGWGVQRLAQEETQMAVYGFDPSIDLEQELAVQYQDTRRGGWEQILQRIQAERARARARARSGG